MNSSWMVGFRRLPELGQANPEVVELCLNCLATKGRNPPRSLQRNSPVESGTQGVVPERHEVIDRAIRHLDDRQVFPCP